MDNYIDNVFPVHAMYKRNKDRIYFATDCKDGEKLEYYGRCEKASSNARGYRYYKDSRGYLHLVHYNDIVEVKE